MLWTCGPCGCQGIAADLPRCPQCGEERGMPKATSGGASNAWEQDAPDAAGAEAQPAPVVAGEPAAQVQGEPGPEVPLPPGWSADPGAAPADGAADYGSMTKAALSAEAASRELPTSGTKTDLAARLAEHDASTAAPGPVPDPQG